MINEHIKIKYLVDCQEHLPALAMLWYEELSRHWFANASVEGKVKELTAHLNKDKLPLTLVALLNDKPVGIASLRHTDGLTSTLTPWLGSLVVDPAYRRQKIGETLIHNINSLAKSYGHDTVYLIALDPNITHWYAKLGWETIGTDRLDNLPVTIMRTKQIA